MVNLMVKFLWIAKLQLILHVRIMAVACNRMFLLFKNYKKNKHYNSNLFSVPGFLIVVSYEYKYMLTKLHVSMYEVQQTICDNGIFQDKYNYPALG